MESRTDTNNKDTKQQNQQRDKGANKKVGAIKSEENKNLDQGSQAQPDQQKEEMISSSDYEEGAADSVGQDMRRSRDDAEGFQNKGKH